MRYAFFSSVTLLIYIQYILWSIQTLRSLSAVLLLCRLFSMLYMCIWFLFPKCCILYFLGFHPDYKPRDSYFASFRLARHLHLTCVFSAFYFTSIKIWSCTRNLICIKSMYISKWKKIACFKYTNCSLSASALTFTQYTSLAYKRAMS